MLSTHIFSKSSTVLIIPYKSENAYKLSLIASPIASYLNIPILIYNKNQFEINQVCKLLETTNAYVIGNIEIDLENISIINLRTEKEIQNKIINSVK